MKLVVEALDRIRSAVTEHVPEQNLSEVLEHVDEALRLLAEEPALHGLVTCDVEIALPRHGTQLMPGVEFPGRPQTGDEVEITVPGYPTPLTTTVTRPVKYAQRGPEGYHAIIAVEMEEP